MYQVIYSPDLHNVLVSVSVCVCVCVCVCYLHGCGLYVEYICVCMFQFVCVFVVKIIREGLQNGIRKEKGGGGVKIKRIERK